MTILVLVAYFHSVLSFACQVHSRSQQNVAMHCACGGEVCEDTCLDMRLKVCQDICPGSELLLYKDTDGQSEAAINKKHQKEKEGNYQENY